MILNVIATVLVVVMGAMLSVRLSLEYGSDDVTDGAIFVAAVALMLWAVWS